MLQNITYPKTLEYSSDGDYLPIEFFMLAIPLCKRIDLKLGYFSSNAIRTLAYGFAQFIYNGGHLRIITNHFLSYEDKMLLAAENKASNIVAENEIKNLIDNDLEGLAEILKNGDQHFFNCLKFLLKNNRLELIPVKLKPNKLAHYKQGIMDDGLVKVYFSGSCNFTHNGLIENGETLGIARSWGETSEKLKIEVNTLSIDRICKKEDLAFEYLSVDQITEVIFTKGQDKDLDELVEDELINLDILAKHPKLANTFRDYTKAFRLRLDQEKQRIKVESQKPKFPYSKGPREYQIEAYKKWLANDFKGIFAMATGTGKTITSLNCLLEIYKKAGYYQALILVPTMSLVEQWEKECGKFNFKDNIIKVYSANNWQSELSRMETLKLLNKDFSFVIIATYASFLTPKFQSQFKELHENTLLIADECHNMGSTSILKKLKSIHLQKRIGLSATPERQYQEEINNTIREFFGEKPENDYTFSYSMEDAIKKEPKALCPYRYYPKIVRLTDAEFKEYVDYTRRIVAMHPKSDEEKEIFNRLCIARQRIVHKAENKLDAFKSILLEEYAKRKNLKYTLVYVPEGLADEDVIFDAITTDILLETDADRNLLNLYTRTIGELFENVPVKQFIGSTSSYDRKRILNDFANGDLQIITSMKCLDEGIDVPRSELAIFCASTGNQRQFIQRRGRVLRLADGKDEAVIYDLVVVPDPSGDDSLFKTEQGEVAKELRRIRDFAEMSENKHHTRQILDPILKYYQLTL